MAGAASNGALHLTVRLVDPRHRSAVGAARTVFLSNGKVPHHWQHRVFSDGEVFDPIVEDEVPEVERAGETLRLMNLYGRLVRAVHAAAARLAEAAAGGGGGEAAAGAAAAAAAAELRRLLQEAIEATLLPKGFDADGAATLSVEKVLRPPPPPPPEEPAAAAAGGGGGGGVDAPADAPASWWLYRICARLDGVPSVRWSPDVEGSLVYEETYCLEGGAPRAVAAAAAAAR